MGYYDIFESKTGKTREGKIGSMSFEGKAIHDSLRENLGGNPKAIHRETWMRMYPFGVPRVGMMDVEDIDRLANTHIVSAVINRICDIFASAEEEVTSKSGNETEEQRVLDLFENPNSGPWSWEDEKRMWCKDLLKFNTGVMQKMYRKNGEFAEIRSIDASAILINFDYYAMLSDRAYDYIPLEMVTNAISAGKNTYMAFMKNAPAYFQWQYGIPIPFGRKELMISWRYPDNRYVYGKSAIEILDQVIYILIYGTEHHLDFYLRNELPYHGILTFDGATQPELQRFKTLLREKTTYLDHYGDRKHNFYEIPAIGYKGEFITPRISHKDMEVLESFEHFEDIIWMVFGLNKVAMGKAESTTYSNALTMDRAIYKYCVEPLTRKFARAFNWGVCMTEFNSDVRISYPMSDIQGEIMKHQLYRLRLQNKMASVNEIREEEGMEVWDDEKYNTPTETQMGGGGFPFQQQQFTERAEEIKSRVYRGEIVSKEELLELAGEYDY